MPSPPASPRIAASTEPLDTRARIETPEGFDLILRPAGLVPRSLAFSIDLLIRVLVIGGLFLFFSVFSTFGNGLGLLVLFVGNWWYPVLFEVLNQGRTPGKQLMGLRVVHDDGTPIGWAASLTRNLLRFVDMLPFGYGLGAVCCLQHPEFKRLGDLAAGSLVIYRDALTAYPVLPEAVSQAAPLVLTLDEQRAVLEFAERQIRLSPERTQELAEIVALPLQIPADQAVARLNGIARGLLGSP
ncbi:MULTISPECIES: RDD family protein [unclassified Pseudomonas]|uniref:RDD family protein n=1 Tax=unclassified Pseudomonas TaxID=196821 RepID=UPI002AC95BD2|nr:MULTISPECIES: RDD family protein [unclassified Pseudomonas]MEB0039018.1 RDD family protein [Pseudomonas sp. MH10]MEB0120034.1 RDD family protein [Pseudomonas sp. CCI1.2]WPX63463.1 RDD family protein [Pseudomonas sp. MH10]